jgi:cohesin complex subunit SA-1/2
MLLRSCSLYVISRGFFKAFKYLLDLHVLFAPAPKETTDPEDGGFTLTLDDETQHRCAGYLQAEVERFIELLEDDATRPDPKPATDDEQASADEEDERPKSKSKETGNTTQGKRSQKKEGKYRYAPDKFHYDQPCSSGYRVSFVA